MAPNLQKNLIRELFRSRLVARLAHDETKNAQMMTGKQRPYGGLLSGGNSAQKFGIVDGVIHSIYCRLIAGYWVSRGMK